MFHGVYNNKAGLNGVNAEIKMEDIQVANRKVCLSFTLFQ